VPSRSPGGRVEAPHEVDPHLLPREDRAAIVVVRVRDTRDGVLDTQPLRRQARDQVHLVATRDGEEHTGVAHARLLEDGQGRAVPDHGEDVELLRREVRPFRVGLDDHDILVFLREALGEVEADLAGTQHEHSHYRRLSGAVRRCTVQNERG